MLLFVIADVGFHSALPDSITWDIGSRFRRGIPLWVCGWIL